MAAPPRPAPRPVPVEELIAAGTGRGLDAVGVTAAEPLSRARHELERRLADGLTNGMAFTFRNPDRSTNPQRALRDGRSIVVGARSYLADEPPAPGEPAGRVARYAWTDHYAELRHGLEGVAEVLRDHGWRAAVFADDNAVVDREVAWRAGIGWYGKNANLLLPRAGSWYVLGSVITDAELAPVAEPVADACGSCRRCLDGCPTGAIVEPGVVDARRCLAWLLQKPGIFPREHRAALGDRLYGCDDCQEVCPPNVHFARTRPHPADAQAWVPLLALLAAGDEEVLRAHGRWYIAERDPRWVRRNALVVLGNVADGRSEEVGATLRRYLVHRDPHLRAHAVWAAHRLGRDDLLPSHDPDPLVTAELAAAHQDTAEASPR